MLEYYKYLLGMRAPLRDQCGIDVLIRLHLPCDYETTCLFVRGYGYVNVGILGWRC